MGRLNIDETGSAKPATGSAPATATPARSMSKVSLDKPGQTISLSKDDGEVFEDIKVNLNWNRQSVPKQGFWNSLVGSGEMDLDVGVLYETRGGDIGVIQALGDQFGSYNRRPYIELDGDDRTGSQTEGETIRINGAHWDEVKRIMVYAFIYEGAPNWSATDGVVTVSVKNQPPIEVRMTNGRNDRTLCGIVLLENDNGQIKVSREVEYYRDQRELDRAHGWGLSWSHGSK